MKKENKFLDPFIEDTLDQFHEKFTHIVPGDGKPAWGIRVFKDELYWQDVERFLLNKIKSTAELVSLNHKKKIEELLKSL